MMELAVEKRDNIIDNEVTLVTVYLVYNISNTG